MAYNLTQTQKDFLKWIVEQIKAGLLPDEFTVMWSLGSRVSIAEYQGDNVSVPKITVPILDALEKEGLLQRNRSFGDSSTRQFSITAKAFQAVENNFDAADTSFLRHITPLADTTKLDAEIKQRCLPTLAYNGNDPKLWDAALRTAGVILEERLHDIGQISDHNIIGRDLVNRIFGDRGTLASKFTVPGEREGYRDTYAGIVGAFRNPHGHRLIDPTPERAGPTLMFINVLLEMLEELR